MIKNLLAVGDCITLGVGSCLGSSYPELIGSRLGCMVTNRGYTMSTSREGVNLLNDSLKADHDCVILQFGVADAHLTFNMRHMATLKNSLFAQTLRCVVKFYPRHINYMPAVKFSHTP